MFCKHEWKLISEITTKSTVEKAIENGCIFETAKEWDFRKKLIQIVCCNKCGKLKRFVSEI